MTIAWTEDLYVVDETTTIVSACAEIVDGNLCRELAVQASTSNSNTLPQATRK